MLSSHPVSKANEVSGIPGVSKPLLAHQDVQICLARLGFPLIVLDSDGVPSISFTGHSADVIDIAVDDDQQQLVLLDDDEDDLDLFAAGSPFMEVDGSNDSAPDLQSPQQQEIPVPRGAPPQQLVPAPSASAVAGDVVALLRNRNPGPRQLAKITRADLEQMHPNQRIRVGNQLARCLRQQLSRNKTLVQKAKNLKRVADRREKALGKKRKEIEDERARVGPLNLVTSGKSGKRLTAQSGFALGVRRNYSNIACSCLGATVLMDVSGQRVARYEIKTAAAILASRREANDLFVKSASGAGQQFLEILDGHGFVDGSGIPRLDTSFSSGESPWTLYCLSFRSDATNSNIWRRQSLHVVDTTVAWMADQRAVRNFDDLNAFSVQRCLPLWFKVVQSFVFKRNSN